MLFHKKILSVAFAFVLIVLQINPVSVKAEHYKYRCNSPEAAEQAKRLLEEKKFFVDFCSNCSPSAANLRRVEVESVTTQTNECGIELKVKGKLVRGIKPPVFGGECLETLEIYNPSLSLNLEYDKTIDLAYTYIFDSSTKSFITMAQAVGLSVEEICVKRLQMKK